MEDSHADGNGGIAAKLNVDVAKIHTDKLKKKRTQKKGHR